jgi:hypothetical protein
VFIVCGGPETWQQSVMAACLAGPKGTVASHLTAAALFQLWKPPSPPHVTVPRMASGRSQLALVHRAVLSRQDTSLVGAIPCTRPARTVVDAATLLGYEALCELVDDCFCRRLSDPGDLRRAMERAGRGPGRKGLANLERALEVWTPGPMPGSPAEMRLVRRLQQWGFPLPVRQHEIYDAGGRFVAKMDVAWPGPQVGFEYQGERHHGPRHEEGDALRKRRIEALGWQVEFVYKSDLRPGSTRLLQWLAPRLGLSGVA